MIQDDASPGFDVTAIFGPVSQPARNAGNLGFAGNCNAGAMRARGDVILFLNQDTKARPNWFEPLMAAFDDPKVGIVGPKLVTVTPDGDKIQSAGGLYDAGKGPYHRWLGVAADAWMVNEPGPVSWTTGAALAVRRTLFYKVGGFDTGYERGYFEDVDLCEAVKAEGATVWYEPRAVFEHSVGSTGGVPPHVFRANSLRFHKRWDAGIRPDTNVIHVNY